MIFLQGTNFFEGCQCLFEIKTSQYQRVDSSRDIRKGYIMNDNLMMCHVPDAYKDIGEAYVNVRVTYQAYMKAQSQTSVLLTILDKCPAGFACKDYRVMECPKGHFCPGGGLIQTAQMCPIGYYQDKFMTSFCKPCPKGSMCPFMAMEEPIPCPPGYICDKEKLNGPNMDCVKGFYCFAGT